LALVGWGAILATSAWAQAADPYQAIVKRDFGTNAEDLAAIDKEIGETRPDQYARIEAKLLAVLEAPEATMPAKQYVCQALRVVGSPKCVPAVAKLLTDEKLSHVARQVFLGMNDPAVADALQKALGQTTGNVRIGIINTIGDRRDVQSLAALAMLLAGNDEATSRVVLNAIGKIGGAPAADLLDKTRVADPLKDAWAHAYLKTAQSLAAADAARSAKMYQALLDGDYPMPVRAAAFSAVAQAQKDQAVPLVIKTLSSPEALMRRAAAGCILTIPGNAATKAFVAALADLSPEGKAMLLGELSARGDAEGTTDTVNKLVADKDPAVSLAAIKALARLGSATSVPVLSAVIKEPAPIGSEATRTLVELRADGVGAALVKLSETGEPTVREAVFGVLAQRGQADALASVRKSIADSDANVRRAALKTLAALGAAEDLPKLVNMLVAAKDDADREVLAQAISGIGGRMADKNARCEPVIAAMSKADAPAKIRLLTVLSTFGGDQSLKAVKAALAGEAEVHKTAVRALSDWPDAAPIADVLTIAKEDKDKTNQILALRGYIRMVPLAGGRPEQKLASYKQALELATRPDEKKQVLTGLAEIRTVESLKLAEPLLDDAALKREAYTAYEKIAEGLGNRNAAIAKEALTKVVEKSPDGGTRNKAKTALEKIK
ncbi:MAG: HEAT repeat domain-containing protein, partial [Tepidisphaeraceae bacterium]